MNSPARFHVALTADFHDSYGQPKYRDIGLGLFDDAPRIAVAPFGEHHAEIQPEQLAGVHGVIVLTPRVTAHSLSAAADLLAIGRAACQGMIDLTEGRRPRGIVNPAVFDRPGFQAKWARLSNR